MIHAEELKAKVREMADKGMKAAAIRHALPDPKPSIQSIKEWIDPEIREKRYAASRRYKERHREEIRAKERYRTWLVANKGKRAAPPKKLHACECPHPLWTREIHDDTETCLYCGRGRTTPQVAEPGTP